MSHMSFYSGPFTQGRGGYAGDCSKAGDVAGYTYAKAMHGPNIAVAVRWRAGLGFHGPNTKRQSSLRTRMKRYQY